MKQQVGGSLKSIILFFKLCSKYMVHDFFLPLPYVSY